MSWLSAIGNALWDTGRAVVRTVGQAVVPALRGILGDVIDRGRDSLSTIADRGFNAMDNYFLPYASS